MIKFSLIFLLLASSCLAGNFHFLGNIECNDNGIKIGRDCVCFDDKTSGQCSKDKQMGYFKFSRCGNVYDRLDNLANIGPNNYYEDDDMFSRNDFENFTQKKKINGKYEET